MAHDHQIKESEASGVIYGPLTGINLQATSPHPRVYITHVQAKTASTSWRSAQLVTRSHQSEDYLVPKGDCVVAVKADKLEEKTKGKFLKLSTDVELRDRKVMVDPAGKYWLVDSKKGARDTDKIPLDLSPLS